MAGGSKKAVAESVTQYFIKVLVSALVIVAVTELAKRNSLWAAALASLPLTSLLAFVWLHAESASAERVAALSQNIFWLVLPSLVLFTLFPVLLRAAIGFWPSLALSCAATAVAYAMMLWLLPRFGIRL
jgi:hypothetical protein